MVAPLGTADQRSGRVLRGVPNLPVKDSVLNSSETLRKVRED